MKRDKHALNDDGMVLCNPRDKEAAHRVEMEGIATNNRDAVTCRKCLSLLYKRDKAWGTNPRSTTLEEQVREAGRDIAYQVISELKGDR